LPTKKKRASASGSERANARRSQAPAAEGAANSGPQTPAQQFNPASLQGALRMISLMGGVGVGILVYELLLKPVGNWPAVFIGLAAAFLARLFLIWLERLWIRALIRRAERRHLERLADQIDQSKRERKTGEK
jgi:hypothetical protein